MKTFLLFVGYSMMIGGSLLLAVMLYYAVPVLWKERQRKRLGEVRGFDATAQAGSARVASPRVPPPPPPPPSPQEVFDGALRQAMQRGFDDWWKGRDATCPGCGEQTFVVARPRDHMSLSTNTGYGFTYWTQALSCATCAWNTSFMHTDAGPSQSYGLSLDGTRAPRRRWTIRGRDNDRPAGTITAGAGEPLVSEPHPDATTHDKLVLSIAAAQLDQVADAHAQGLADDEAERIFLQATGTLLSMHGCGATAVERVTPVDSVKPEPPNA